MFDGIKLSNNEMLRHNGMNSIISEQRKSLYRSYYHRQLMKLTVA
jgi:hypothetical protein